jgi:hypothetical protein
LPSSEGPSFVSLSLLSGSKRIVGHAAGANATADDVKDVYGNAPRYRGPAGHESAKMPRSSSDLGHRTAQTGAGPMDDELSLTSAWGRGIGLQNQVEDAD